MASSSIEAAVEDSLDDTLLEEDTTTHHDVQFQSPAQPPPVPLEQPLTKLIRCTSTPMNNETKSLSSLFAAASPVSIHDSGFESASFSDSSLAEKSLDRSKGAIPKRTFPVITRSRSRQWSGSLENQSPSTSVLIKSLTSFDLRKYPKDDSGIEASTSSSSSGSKKIRIVYRPGLFEGRETVDIVKRLNDMGTFHILRQIWRYLTEEDLAKVMQVSTSWNAAVLADPDAICRYIDAKEKFAENALNYHHVKARLTKTSPRKALSSVSNLLLSPVKQRPLEQRRSPRLASSPNAKAATLKKSQTIVSPSKFRHKLFTEEAQRLGPDEKLQPCPRCTGPSRVIPSEDKASCSRISCQFMFCTLCMCSFHKGSPCRLIRGCKIKPPSPTSSSSSSTSGLSCKARVSSKLSKRRLKRL